LLQVLLAHIDHSRNGVLGMAAVSDPDMVRDLLRSLDELRLVAVTMANITRDGVALQRGAGAGSVVDLPDLLKTTVRMHRRLSKGRLRLDEHPAQTDVLAPRGALLRVLANLVNNAIDVIPDGAAGRVSLTAWIATDNVFVQVADNGPGIPEELQHKIFDLFFTTKEKGSGVGLPTCRKLVEAWGGNLQLQSKVGEGTRFTFGVPRA
jgi:signal transduction histidine kinase